MNATLSHHLGRKRTLPIGTVEFLLHYGLRSDFSDQYRTHAIISEAVIEQYSKALVDGYELLTNSEFCWPRLPHRVECNVAVRDLGLGRFGLANPGSDSATLKGCYLALTSRPLETSVELDACMRRTIAIHELVHLLQFPSTLYRSGERCSSAFIMDPNWWMHESVALATEWFLGGASGKLLPHLWNWANSPHISCQTDELGFQAFPFMVYLMETYGKSLPARLYNYDLEKSTSNVGAIEASEWLDEFIQSLNFEGKKGSLHSSFIRYACLWVFPDSQLPNWAQQIVQVVGRPAWTQAQAVSEFKWQAAPIQRLGFRIMPISKPSSFDCAFNTMLEWHVHYDCQSRSDRDAIQGAVVTIDGGGRVRIHEGHFNGDRYIVRCPRASLVDSQQLFLVIANTKVGPGRGNHDLDPISIDLVSAD